MRFGAVIPEKDHGLENGTKPQRILYFDNDNNYNNDDNNNNDNYHYL